MSRLRQGDMMVTRQDWFAVHNNLIDRQDLTLYEKMCCIVLARYADRSEFDNLLTLDVIANKMGCDKQSAERALFGLMTKGLLDLEDSGDGKIIHPESGQDIKTPIFESMAILEPPKPASPVEGKSVKKEKSKIAVNSDEFLLLLDQVYDIVQEKINEREARIILNFADHDLDLIREKYAIAKKTQISDKIEVLINELQKKPGHKPSDKGHRSEGTAKEATSTKGAESTTSTESTESSPSLLTSTSASKPASQVQTQPGGQINLVNINKMKLYKEMASQADHLKSKGK